MLPTCRINNSTIPQNASVLKHKRNMNNDCLKMQLKATENINNQVSKQVIKFINGANKS